MDGYEELSRLTLGPTKPEYCPPGWIWIRDAVDMLGKDMFQNNWHCDDIDAVSEHQLYVIRFSLKTASMLYSTPGPEDDLAREKAPPFDPTTPFMLVGALKPLRALKVAGIGVMEIGIAEKFFRTIDMVRSGPSSPPLMMRLTRAEKASLAKFLLKHLPTADDEAAARGDRVARKLRNDLVSGRCKSGTIFDAGTGVDFYELPLKVWLDNDFATDSFLMGNSTVKYSIKSEVLKEITHNSRTETSAVDIFISDSGLQRLIAGASKPPKDDLSPADSLPLGVDDKKQLRESDDDLGKRIRQLLDAALGTKKSNPNWSIRRIVSDLRPRDRLSSFSEDTARKILGGLYKPAQKRRFPSLGEWMTRKDGQSGH